MNFSLQEYFMGDQDRPFTNKEAADKNRNELLRLHPWMAAESLGTAAAALANENASQRSRVTKILKLVDKAGMAIADVSPCRRGCSHCCHIPTVIFSSEAERIGQLLGRKPAIVPARNPNQIKQMGEGDQYTGEPCPFLREGECSIYEVRPFACRAHHSIDDSADQCDLRIPSKESSVPTYSGMRVVELVYASLLFNTDVIGDIREFFPVE